MFGWDWWRAVVLCGIAWGWASGCGPKPMDLWVEPYQHMVLSPTDAVDEGEEQPIGPAENEAIGENSAPPVAEPVKAVSAEKPPLIHKVRWGHETLYSIARWYTGKGSNWRHLAAANPKIKPRRMRIGEIIRIPGPLLTTRHPMPETYLRPRSARSSSPSPESDQKQPSIEPEIQTPPLYGPVVDDATPSSEEKDVLPVPLETLDD